MKTCLTVFSLLIMTSAVGCDATKSKPATLADGNYDQMEMDAAIAKARSEVDSFIAILTARDGDDFAVKAPITDNGKVEHFWITELVFQNGEFEGVINNEPGVVSNVRIGQKWKINKQEISDWMFMRNGKMHGNYTMRPLLKTLPPAEAAQYRQMLAD